MKNIRNTGFTLVELLIVIVVIAILATISIVTYTGIQERAHVAKVAAAFSHYVKILEIHKAQHGHYPDTTDSGWVCLGETDNYPAEGIFDEGQCNVEHDDTIYEVDPAVISALRNTLGGSLPDASYSPVDDSYGSIRGLLYGHWGNRIAIASYTKGDNPCPLGDADERQYYDGITRCLSEIYE